MTNSWPSGNALLSPPRYGDDLAITRRKAGQNTTKFNAPCAMGWPQGWTEWVGSQWTGSATASDVAWTRVAWSPELRLLVATNTQTNTFMVSANGVPWEEITLPTSATNWQAIVWSRKVGIFLAVTQNVLARSFNGYNWTSQTLSIFPSARSLIWVEETGQFVIVGDSGSNRLGYSADGTTWTQPATASYGLGKPNSIAYSPTLGLYAISSDSGETVSISTSPDLVTWTTRLSGTFYSNMTWCNFLGCFFATGFGDDYIQSFDGVNWSTFTPRIAGTTTRIPFGILVVANELNKVFAFTTSGTENRVLVTDDLRTWEQKSTVDLDNIWQGGCWAPEIGRLVAVASSGAGNRVMTSI